MEEGGVARAECVYEAFEGVAGSEEVADYGWGTAAAELDE